MMAPHGLGILRDCLYMYLNGCKLLLNTCAHMYIHVHNKSVHKVEELVPYTTLLISCSPSCLQQLSGQWPTWTRESYLGTWTSLIRWT